MYPGRTFAAQHLTVPPVSLPERTECERKGPPWHAYQLPGLPCRLEQVMHAGATGCAGQFLARTPSDCSAGPGAARARQDQQKAEGNAWPTIAAGLVDRPASEGDQQDETTSSAAQPRGQFLLHGNHRPFKSLGTRYNRTAPPNVRTGSGPGLPPLSPAPPPSATARRSPHVSRGGCTSSRRSLLRLHRLEQGQHRLASHLGLVLPIVVRSGTVIWASMS